MRLTVALETLNPRAISFSEILSLACVLSLRFPNALGWIVYTYALSATGLLVPIFVGYFKKGKRNFSGQTVFISMIVSGIVVVIAKANGSFGTPLPQTFFGVLVSIASMYLLSIFFKDNIQSDEEKMVG